jgi:hypothetical protein
LKTIGVLENVLWMPSRVVSTSTTDTVTIKDTLWPPTERENPNGSASSTAVESAANQAQLEYCPIIDAPLVSLIKYSVSGSVNY